MIAVINEQTNTLVRIDSVWAAVSVDDDGTEGICAAMLPNGMIAPLLAADEARLDWIISQAELIAAATQRQIRIIRMHSREEVRVIDGGN